jgi:hypothetical protein
LACPSKTSSQKLKSLRRRAANCLDKEIRYVFTNPQF